MRISSLTVLDYVNIVGHYNKLQHGPTIDPRLLERFKDKPEMVEKIKLQSRAKGSGLQSLNIKFKAPLESFNYPLFGYVLTLYRKYSDLGVLPFSGALADQPSQIIEIFNTLDSVELEIKQEQQREQERQSRSKRKGR